MTTKTAAAKLSVAGGEVAPAASKKVTDTGRPKPPNAGKGRPKGAQNKENKALREMILEALDRKGGSDYLVEQADKNPKAFLSLLGRVLPLQVSGEGGGPLEISVIKRVIVDPK